MAYQFKKLSDVELLDTVPEGATVLAEVDGEIRRVPSNGLGGGWENIQDKPFGEQNVEITVSGADVDLNTTFDGLGYRWYWCCDDTLTLEQIIGATVKMVYQHDTYPNGDYVISSDNVMAANDNGTAVLLETSAFIMAYQPGEVTLEAMGENVTVKIPKPGLYYIGDETEPFLLGEDSFTIFKSDITTLDPKYIPDEIKLPTVTEADNGKVLMVVDGKWAVVDLPST